ncbi:hypothetical protein Pcinc_007861 [Petrolisthes cinctipes]|uniref:Uncharacterized protein n=1 Tax=Petrolisthes cinctipes TaxID=88211 RepID=A0AAE1GA20_PETCI|nr:hypothetical protein Pcinc_007861 [Petrolisthes cinctipes]
MEVYHRRRLATTSRGRFPPCTRPAYRHERASPHRLQNFCIHDATLCTLTCSPTRFRDCLRQRFCQNFGSFSRCRQATFPFSHAQAWCTAPHSHYRTATTRTSTQTSTR